MPINPHPLVLDPEPIEAMVALEVDELMAMIGYRRVADWSAVPCGLVAWIEPMQEPAPAFETMYSIRFAEQDMDWASQDWS